MLMEKKFEQKEKDLKEKIRTLENDCQEEREKLFKLEKAIKALETGDKEHINNKLIDLTRQNSILDMNLLRLTKKYNNLFEQEKMLRREYHNKDHDMAEKDMFV